MPRRDDSPGDRASAVEHLRRGLVAVHRDRDGAVVVMALAACLILFMLGMVLYDAGYVSRDKLDAQMAADTAAYSQAAVEARAMNHIAFANVAKRTTVGIRNAYMGGYRAYERWVAKKCGECSDLNVRACITCWTNDIVLDIERIEFEIFKIMRLAGDTLTDYLETLDAYQTKMRDYAPYWGTAEAIIRGVRNGANYIGTYPMPETDEYGKLPIAKGSGFGARQEACLAANPHNPVTPNTQLEFRTNIEVLKEESSHFPFPENITDVPDWMMYEAVTEACMQWSLDPAEPMHLTADLEHPSGEDYLSTSHFVFGYRQNEAFDGQLREKFGIIGKDYEQKHNYTTPGGGMWSMARAEIYFPESRKPKTGKEGKHGIWMFHPGWIGKMRPVVFPGEDLPVRPSQMWKEARTTFKTLGPQFGVDAATLQASRRYMTKVMYGFDGEIAGKEVMDGTSK